MGIRNGNAGSTLGELTYFNLDHLSSSFPCRKCRFFFVKKPLMIWGKKRQKKIKTSSLIAFNFGHCFEEILWKKMPHSKPPNVFGGCFSPQKNGRPENTQNFGDGVFDQRVSWPGGLRISWGGSYGSVEHKNVGWLMATIPLGWSGWPLVFRVCCEIFFWGVHIYKSNTPTQLL